MPFIISPYLMLLVALLASCKVEDKQAKEEAEQQAIRAEMQGKLDEIAKTFKQRYNADSTWRDALKGKPISTYALQKELIRSDERPVFAGGTLFDIEKRGKGVTLIFSVSGFGESTLRQEFLLMELKCPLLAEREVERLKVGEFSPWDTDPDYLIAAKIGEVSQAHQILPNINKEPDLSTLGTLRVEYVAKGQCVGLEPIGMLFEEYTKKLKLRAKHTRGRVDR